MPLTSRTRASSSFLRPFIGDESFSKRFASNPVFCFFALSFEASGFRKVQDSATATVRNIENSLQTDQETDTTGRKKRGINRRCEAVCGGRGL